MTAFNPATHGVTSCTVRLKLENASPSPPALDGVQPHSTLDEIDGQNFADAEARRRRKVIDDAFQEWRLHRVTLVRQNPTFTWRGWVNAALQQEDFPPLTKAEIKERDS